MKYKLEILIDKPRAEVWRLFCDHEKINLWQPSIIKIEPVSGRTGGPVVSKWIYKANEREYSLTEKILSHEQPNRFESVFENEFAENTVDNRFTELDRDQTLWVAETKYKFKTLLMILLGPFMKKRYEARSRLDMERFKEMLEKA